MPVLDSVRPTRLFAADLDGMLVGDADSSGRFREFWETSPRGRRPLLVYNSGRSIPDARMLLAKQHLPASDYLIGGAGTEIFGRSHRDVAEDFAARFREGWDLSAVDRIVGATPGIACQPPSCRHAFKSSWQIDGASRPQIDELRDRLAAAGLQVTVVYSSLRDLDVLPRRAGKGNALSWLCHRLAVSLEDVVVAGDLANDSSMFLLPGVRRIVVGDARREPFESIASLSAFVATTAFADGVMEGLRHFGVLAQTENR